MRRNTNKNSVENHTMKQRGPGFPVLEPATQYQQLEQNRTGKVRKPPNRICEFNILQKRQMKPVRERVLRKLELRKENVKLDPILISLTVRCWNTETEILAESTAGLYSPGKEAGLLTTVQRPQAIGTHGYSGSFTGRPQGWRLYSQGAKAKEEPAGILKHGRVHTAGI